MRITVDQHLPSVEREANSFFRGNFFPIVGVPLLNVNSHLFLQLCSLYKFDDSKLEITTWVLHLDRVVNKVRVGELFVLYIYLPFFIGWFTTYLNLVRTRPVWVILCKGYTARPINRVGIRPDVTRRTSGVHCTIKYRPTTSDTTHTGLLIRTFGDVSERGRVLSLFEIWAGICLYMVPSCPWVFGWLFYLTLYCYC
jgi:hypothetical protein